MSTKASRNEICVKILQTRLNQRGENLSVDGDAGSITMAALDRRFPDRSDLAPTPAVVLPVNGAPDRSRKHYDLLKTYLGVKETAGSATNPKLQPAFALLPSWLSKDDSKTAWCGVIRGYIGFQLGTGMPPEHYRAAAWEGWGTAVDLKKPTTWQKGDTIIMKRTGGFHVCLLDRVEGSKVYCLGGNQSNAVTIAPFAISGITAVRR